MNDAHYHLVLNHLPIIFPLIGFIIMIGGFIFRSDIIKRTAYFIFFLGALATIPAFLTGEGAEEVVEQIQGIDEKFIGAHEEAAELFAILSYVLGGLSLIGFWANYKHKSFSSVITLIVAIFSVIVLFFAQQTGTSGGEIRHTEIRTDSGNSSINLLEIKEKGENDDDH